MIGIWSEHATTYLLVVSTLTAVLFSGPLMTAPLSWAKIFRWKLPVETDLAVYFGRCLGAVALALNAVTVRAALTGDGLIAIFLLTGAISALMVLVHLWGAIRRIQPLAETLEIGFWGALFVLTLMFWPAPLGRA